MAQFRLTTRILLVILSLQSSSFMMVCARPQYSQTSSHPVNDVSTRTRELHRTLQSWVIRHQSSKRKIRAPQIKFKDGTGSVITFSSPTKERIADWFGPEDDPDNMLRSMLRKDFNHDSVGMTNPFLHLDACRKEEDDLFLSVKKDIMEVTLPVSRVEASRDQQSSSWWPSLSFNPNRKKEWRVLTYRKRVGRGRECYERVRDAALDWEFASQDGLLGMKKVPSFSNMQQRGSPPMEFKNRRSYSVRSTPTDDPDEPMAFHRTIGSFRRMVTYSASKLPFVKKIYAVNPVMAVYDLVDQRAPDTTFTSTAYATMKGHLLRGEERVTVALRDRSEAVDVEIVSISRSGDSIKAKSMWPFIGKMQNNFFQSQIQAFQDEADNANQAGQGRLLLENGEYPSRVH